MNIGTIILLKQKMRLVLAFTVFITFLNYSFSFSAGSRGANYSCQSWQTKDGLPQNSVTSIIQSKDGYLWLGTLEGLARFDGVQFVVFDQMTSDVLKSNRIISLCEDRNGKIWVGTDGGGLCTFSNNTFSTEGIAAHLLHGSISHLNQDEQGNIWVSTNGAGVTKISSGGYRQYTVKDGLLSNEIASLATGKNGVVWVGTFRDGINIITDTGVVAITERDGLIHNAIQDILIRNDNSVVISTMEGLSIYKDGVFRNITTQDGLTSNSMWSLHELNGGTVLIGTSGGGLNILEGETLLHYTTSEGLSNNYVWSMQEDREGNIWIGTNGGGLNRLRKALFTTYAVEEGLSDNFVWSVCPASTGGLWIGTYNGLNYFDGENFTHITKKDGLPSTFVFSVMAESDGTIWGGTMNGLVRLQGKRITTFTKSDGLAGDEIHTVYRDKKGVLWIGTATGLSSFKDSKFTSYTDATGFPNTLIMALMEDRTGRLWVGARTGLYEIQNGVITDHTQELGISTSGVRSLYEDSQGNIWVGTQDVGLIVYRNGKFSSISRKNGLFDNVISQILDDGLGYLWMSSNKGIFRTSVQQLIDFADGAIAQVQCYPYNSEDGMRNQECNGSSQPAGCKTPDGRLWFPTIRGVVTVDPKTITNNNLVPPIVIEQVIADDIPITDFSKIEIPPGNGNLEIHYTALSLVVQQRVFFKYMLEGYDNTWQDVGTRRVAYYTNLSHGTYTFKVIACNNDGVWNELGQSVKVVIIPPYWKTWWFRTAVILAVMLMLYGIYRYRLNRMLEIERTRTRIARDLHDEVSASISGVMYFAQAVRNDSANVVTPSSNKFLSLIQESVSEIQDSMQDIIWSLNTENDNWENVLSKFRRYVSDACESRAIEYKLDIPSTLPLKPLSMERRKNLWLIYKEIVTNAVKHSQATLLYVTILLDESGMIVLKISDNGIGFDPSKPTDRNGVKNIRSRIEFLKGTLQLETAPGDGAKWEIRFEG